MPKSIALIIHSLAGGGAERVVSLLANHWAEQGRDVVIITLDVEQNDAYPLDPRVRRIGLDFMRASIFPWQGVFNNFFRIRALRRALQTMDAPIPVSFTDKMNIVAVLACRGMEPGLTICERTDPRHQQLGRVWSWLRRRCYPRCRALVVQTEDVRTWVRGWLPGRPIHVIPNAAPAVSADARSATESEAKRIVSVGRLSREKGHDLLIAAFLRIAPKYPAWRLTICGDGAERANLDTQRQQLGLQDRVELPGWIRDPGEVLRKAELFVLPSRYEGFPNALLEAMAAGLACVSFDCESGPREIIRHAENGLLVPAEDVGELANAMERLITDTDLRCKLGKAARHVSQRFSQDRFFRQWDAVLEGAEERVVDQLAGRAH
jgi:glycosyltransferase involved in cell wall biosynthesis